ncbi:MAG: hypothetical protein K6G17_05150 [Oscillospiraceae bacterium]|nr:hypothetical protein [Oscillospiraceae bacterium]
MDEQSIILLAIVAVALALILLGLLLNSRKKRRKKDAAWSSPNLSDEAKEEAGADGEDGEAAFAPPKLMGTMKLAGGLPPGSEGKRTEDTAIRGRRASSDGRSFEALEAQRAGGRICPYCEAVVPAGQGRCPACGARLDE